MVTACRICQTSHGYVWVGLKERLTVDDVAAAYPYLDKNGVKLMMLKDRIAKAQTIGPWKDRWVSHPLPTLSETDKAMCHLTDIGAYAGDLDHLAWLYNKASLHAVDSFFNRIRRRSSMLERPIHSSANRGRVYSHYSAYRPEQVNKIQTILRACHNYVWPGEGKKAPPGTPATRLGLAKAVRARPERYSLFQVAAKTTAERRVA
jgi:hypothetical protein